jgi:hypothetical protein
MKKIFLTLFFIIASSDAMAKDQFSNAEVVFLGNLSMKANNICDKFDTGRLANIYPDFPYLTGNTKECHLIYDKYADFLISNESNAEYDPITNNVLEINIRFTANVFEYLLEIHKIKYGMPHTKTGEGYDERVIWKDKNGGSVHMYQVRCPSARDNAQLYFKDLCTSLAIETYAMRELKKIANNREKIISENEERQRLNKIKNISNGL